MPVRRQSKQRHEMNGVSICKTYDCASVALSFNPVFLLLLRLLRGLLWFSCNLLCMQHSVLYNNIKKVNGWCKQILPKLILRIYSIMYLPIFYVYIQSQVFQVILSLRILWIPKTTVWNHRIVPIIHGIHASFHPGQAMKELTRVNATITIIQQIKEFLWNRNIHPDVRPNPPKTIFAVENVYLNCNEEKKVLLSFCVTYLQDPGLKPVATRKKKQVKKPNGNWHILGTWMGCQILSKYFFVWNFRRGCDWTHLEQKKPTIYKSLGI